MGARTPDRLPELTERQLEVARLVARDLSNREIAERLDVSLDTAKAHVSALLSRLNLASREEIAVWYRSGDRHRSRRAFAGLLWPLGVPAAATVAVVIAGALLLASSGAFETSRGAALAIESPTEIVEQFLDHYIALLRDYRHVDGTFEPNPEAALALALTSARVRGIVSDAAVEPSEALFELVLAGAVPVEPPLIAAARVGVLDASVLTTWTWRPGGPDVREIVGERDFHLVLEDGRWAIDSVDPAPVTSKTPPEEIIRSVLTLGGVLSASPANSDRALELRRPLVETVMALFTPPMRDRIAAQNVEGGPVGVLFEPVSDHPLGSTPELVGETDGTTLVQMRWHGPGLESSTSGPVQTWTLVRTDEGWRIDGLATDGGSPWTPVDAVWVVARAAGNFGMISAPQSTRTRLASANLPVFSERLAAELLRSDVPLDSSIARLFGITGGALMVPGQPSMRTEAGGRATVAVSFRSAYVPWEDTTDTHHLVYLILERGQWRIDAVEEVEAG